MLSNDDVFLENFKKKEKNSKHVSVFNTLLKSCVIVASLRLSVCLSVCVSLSVTSVPSI